MAKRHPIKSALEWFGMAHTVHTIAQAEFFRTLFFPAVMAVATGAAGWLGGIPVMFVIVAVLLSFMAASQGILSASTYLERKNPSHKLQVLRTIFTFDLVAIGGPNRRQRRAAIAQGGAPAVPAYRHLTKAQLGFEVWNKASFPISVILISAETTVEGISPPRARYPKAPTIIEPGTTIWIHDDPIDMGEMQCDNLDGKMDIKVRYGLPGKERFDINHEGTVEIFMEPYGFLKNVYFHPSSSVEPPR